MFGFKRIWKYKLDLEIYTDKIAESGRRIIRKAHEEARDRDHNQIAPEHILLAIAEAEEPFFIVVMQSLNLDPQAIFDAFDTHLDSDKFPGRGIKMSESFRTLEANAWKNARLHRRRWIEAGDFLIALFQDEQSFSFKFFQQLGIDREIIIQRIQDHEHLIGTDNSESQTQQIRKRPRNEKTGRIIIGNEDFNP